MKKLFLNLLVCGVLLLTGLHVNAQSGTGNTYKTAVGVRVDFGDGGTGFGFNAKHFYSANNAVDGNLIFFDGGAVGLGAEYQYNSDIFINGEPGLKYYLGIGPNFIFGNGYTDVQIRPVAGLDYKINASPIDFAFDWRPMFTLNHGTDFNAARFGLSVRYTF